MNPLMRLYSVICAKADHTEHVVATGLSLLAARRLCVELDQKFRERVELQGKTYSSWTADLHHCQLEVNRPANMEALSVLRAQLDLQIKVLKANFETCESASQKNALGTSILTINSLAAAVHGTILSLHESGEVKS